MTKHKAPILKETHVTHPSFSGFEHRQTSAVYSSPTAEKYNRPHRRIARAAVAMGRQALGTLRTTAEDLGLIDERPNVIKPVKHNNEARARAVVPATHKTLEATAETYRGNPEPLARPEWRAADLYKQIPSKRNNLDWLQSIGVAHVNRGRPGTFATRWMESIDNAHQPKQVMVERSETHLYDRMVCNIYVQDENGRTTTINLLRDGPDDQFHSSPVYFAVTDPMGRTYSDRPREFGMEPPEGNARMPWLEASSAMEQAHQLIAQTPLGFSDPGARAQYRLAS